MLCFRNGRFVEDLHFSEENANSLDTKYVSNSYFTGQTFDFHIQTVYNVHDGSDTSKNPTSK